MSQWLSVFSDVTGVVGGLLLLYIGLMRFVPPVQVALILRPLGWRRARRTGIDKTTWLHLRHAAKGHIRGQNRRPGDVLGELLQLHGEAEWPTPWTKWRQDLASCLRRATAPDVPLVAARLVVPEQVSRLETLLTDMARLLERMDRVVPVPNRLALQPPPGAAQVSSVAFASALSGAAVLVDAGGSRSRTADNVLVWPATSFRDHDVTWEQKKTYSEANPHLAIDESSRLGDYNGRLIELNAVSLATNSSEGEVSFVLETSETSYRATEPPGELAAKGLFPTGEDERLPVFRRIEEAAYRRTSGSSATPRACPVTSYVSLMTRSAPEDGVRVLGLPPSHPETEPVEMLVLCRRSAATRNGSGTLSATAGGVVELDQGETQLDTDELGVPDVTGAALREMTEELGIPTDAVTAAPVATFLATVNGHRSAKPGRGAGQLVACVLHLGTTSMGLPGLIDARQDASASRGAFEVDSLEAIAMLPGPSGLAEFVRTVRSHARELDQHGLLTCFYAALRFYASGVIDAFAAEFDRPWWTIPWAGEEQEARVRVVRDVRKIVPDNAGLIEEACSRWSEDWVALLPGLNQQYETLGHDSR